MSCRALALVSVVLLSACGENAPPAGSSTSSSAPAAAVAPSDPELAQLYAQTCRTCHTNPATGAPPTGDRQAWEPRLKQGMPALLDHTIGGYKGMPPMGSCMDCSEQDFEALIRFMAGEAS